MVSSVNFRTALEKALKSHGPFDGIIEVGPHPALKGPVTQTIKSVVSTTLPYFALLNRTMDDNLALSEFLGTMWCHYGPQVANLHQYIKSSANLMQRGDHLKTLPTYSWDHSQIHYREPRVSFQYHNRSEAPHELLGVRTRDDNEYELRWRNILKLDKVPWLEHHKFQGQALVPASAYCVMALDAARVLFKGQQASLIQLQDLDIISGISIEPGSQGTEILFSLHVLSQPKEFGSQSIIKAAFTLTSCPADGTVTMKKNMSGNLEIILGEPSVDALPPREPCMSETLPASTDAFYKMMDATELIYSGPFRSLENIERRYRYATTTLRRFHPEDTTNLAVSPATLDSCFQSAFLSYAFPGDRYASILRFQLHV